MGRMDLPKLLHVFADDFARTNKLLNKDPSLVKLPWLPTREGVDGLCVGGVLADVVSVELAEEVAAVPLGLVLRVLQHRRRRRHRRGDV